MSGLSDRDQKIIYILLIAMIIFMPYFFFIKDKRVEIQTVKNSNVQLEERLHQLQEMDTKRDWYKKETKKMNDERDEIIESFPAGITTEHFTMFLLNTEYSSEIIKDEDGNEVLKYPMLFDSVAYGENVETPISSEEVDTGFNGYTNGSVVTYRTYYGGLKYMLGYLLDYEDPMTYREITMEFDENTGVITGEMLLEQYAISGGDRELPPVDFKINWGKDKIELDLKKMGLRGVEEVGVFGPKIQKFVDEDQVVTAGDDEEELEEAEEE